MAARTPTACASAALVGSTNCQKRGVLRQRILARVSTAMGASAPAGAVAAAVAGSDANGFWPSHKPWALMGARCTAHCSALRCW